VHCKYYSATYFFQFVDVESCAPFCYGSYNCAEAYIRFGLNFRLIMKNAVKTSSLTYLTSLFARTLISCSSFAISSRSCMSGEMF
jgi:hypothetical protein